MRDLDYNLTPGVVILLGALVTGCASGPATLGPADDVSTHGSMGMTGDAAADSSSPAVEDLDRYVLIIQESSSGHVTHSWRAVEEFDLSQFRFQPRAERTYGRIVLAAARQRDCHKEFNECINMCMKRPLSEDYSHIEASIGAKREHCTKLCMQPYLDCEELQERRPQEFSATARAVDGLKRNRNEVVAGSLVVVAGVAFFVFFPPAAIAGAAAKAMMVLVPVAALASSNVACEPRIVVGAP